MCIAPPVWLRTSSVVALPKLKKSMGHSRRGDLDACEAEQRINAHQPTHRQPIVLQVTQHVGTMAFKEDVACEAKPCDHSFGRRSIARSWYTRQRRRQTLSKGPKRLEQRVERLLGTQPREDADARVLRRRRHGNDGIVRKIHAQGPFEHVVAQALQIAQFDRLCLVADDEPVTAVGETVVIKVCTRT